MSDPTLTGSSVTPGVRSSSADGGADLHLGQALSAVTQDISTLMQQEVALAKAEASQAASRAGQSVGMFAGAGVAGFLFVLFLSISLWWAIGNSTGRGWAALIVAVLWAIVAAILAVVAKKRLDRIKGLPRTTDTLAKVPNALKGQEEMNR